MASPDSHTTAHDAVVDRKRKRDCDRFVRPPVNYGHPRIQRPNIPARPDSPPRSPRPDTPRPRTLSFCQPPIAGGGPLSSHPPVERANEALANEDPMTGVWPPTPDPDMAQPSINISTHNSHTSDNHSSSTRTRADSFTSPTSPTGPPMYPTNNQHRTGTVRRLLSLSSLRQSFSSSRTSLSQRPDTSHGSYQHSYTVSRAESPSIMSTTASTVPTASMRMSDDQRPSTSLRKKRSSSWFKRKSNFFGANDDASLDVLDEDGPEHKRFKDKQLPTLPEIGALSGGSLDGGSIGWDDQLFKRE